MGVGGATSPGDALQLQAMLAQANKVLDQKAAISAGAKQEKAYQSVTNALNLQLAALTETDRQKEIDAELSKAKVSASSKEGQAITEVTGRIYDQKQAIEQNNQATAFFASTFESDVEGMVTGTE